MNTSAPATTASISGTTPGVRRAVASGRCMRAWLSAGFALLFAWSSVSAQSPDIDPREVKAAMVFHFTAFLEWPAFAFEDQGAPLVIGVFGDDEFADILAEVVRGESAQGHAIVVRRCRTAADARRTHLLFLASSERTHLQSMLSATSSRPIVTVSEVGEFAERGGMIELHHGSDGRVRLLINPQALKSRGISASSKLLRLAEIVSRPTP